MNKYKPLILVVVVIILFAGGSYLYNNMNEKLIQENNIKRIEESNTNNNIDEITETQTTQDMETDKILAPDFELKDLDGNTITLSDYVGKIVVLNFWASWCGPCKSEMPDFNELYEEEIKDNEDIVFFAINLTDRQRETEAKVRKFVEKNNITIPVLLDEGAVTGYYYGVDSIPVTIVIDREGNVETGIMGMTDKQTLKDMIAEVDK